MRLANLFVAVALLYGPALRAQNQTLIEPGDILVVKLLSPRFRVAINKTVVVMPDGNLKLPLLRGIGPRENVISVGGMGIDDAAQNVAQSYNQNNRRLKKLADFRSDFQDVQAIIERGTLHELLSQ